MILIVPATYVWILLNQLTIAVEARFIGPENTAVTLGGSAVLTCSSPNNSLRWSTRRKGPGVEELITRSGMVLPQYTHEYNVTRGGSGQLNLVIISAKFNDSGRYICLESSTSNSASAELIVVESFITCNSAEPSVTCDVSHAGSLIPDVEFYQKDRRNTDDSDSSSRLTRKLDLSLNVSVSDIYYICTVRFRKDETKTFIGENVNGVVGTAANNVPSYLNTKYMNGTECTTPSPSPAPSHAAINSLSIPVVITLCLHIFSSMSTVTHRLTADTFMDA